MRLTDIVLPEAVIPTLKATSKKQLLQELAGKAAALTGLDEREIFSTLPERERLGATGMGRGVAIPHGRMAGLTSIQGLFARLDRGVDFDAVDDAPVDLVFLLLAPENAGADHLKALARVSRLMRDADTCAKLRGARDGAAIYALPSQDEASQAA